MAGKVWWGEAADEPAPAPQSEATAAREDTRPTKRCKIYRRPILYSWPAARFVNLCGTMPIPPQPFPAVVVPIAGICHDHIPV